MVAQYRFYCITIVVLQNRATLNSKNRNSKCLELGPRLSLGKFKALASDALQRYCNAILRKCDVILDFRITLFYVVE